MLEPSLFSLYLHQNMPEFFGDIEDLADCLDNFSHQDDVTSSTTFHHANMQELYDLERLSGLICGQSVTETNLHCAKLSRQGAKPGMMTMQKPQYFEHIQNIRLNKQILRECAKEGQLVAGELLSEDLLIRSQQEAIKNTVPYLTQM